MLAALLVVAAGSVCAWMMLGRPDTGIDDADIFFVYARHMAEGHGWVYNIGGERVEGFTSLLWAILSTLLFYITDHVEMPLYLINLLFGAATVWACMQRVRSPILFLFLLAAVPAWFAWCQVTLMETGLWCCLLTLAVLAAVDRRAGRLTLLLPLLVLTRPESMLWGAWLILIFGWANAGRDGFLNGVKRSAMPAAVFVAALLGIVIFRMAYFGYPVPNTFYAKVSPSLSTNLWIGTGYLFEFLYTNPAVLLVTLTWIRVLVRGLRRWRQGIDQATLIAVGLLPGIVIPLLVGGDHFGGSRFYQPIWPLLCLLAADAWPELIERAKPMRVRIVMPAMVLAGWVLFPFTARLEHEFRIAQNGRETGRALTAMFRDLNSYPTVATITAGGSKYTYAGTVLDLMGLNTTEMAHAAGSRTGYKNHTAFSRDVFYAWHPDIVLCGEDAGFDAFVLKGLPDDERFRSMYVKAALQRNGHEVTAYYSHALLERIQERPR